MTDNEMNYINAMTQAKIMCIKNIISNEEYLKIELKIAEKYGLNSLSLYRANDLIKEPKRVINMIQK